MKNALLFGAIALVAFALYQKTRTRTATVEVGEPVYSGGIDDTTGDRMIPGVGARGQSHGVLTQQVIPGSNILPGAVTGFEDRKTSMPVQTESPDAPGMSVKSFDPVMFY